MGEVFDPSRCFAPDKVRTRTLERICSAMFQRRRRLLVSMGVLTLIGLWIDRGNGPVALVWDLLFGAFFIASLSMTFEWQALDRAPLWRTLGALELVGISGMTVNALAQHVWKSLGLMSLKTDMVPTSMRALISIVAATEILLVYWLLTYVFPYMADDVRLRAMEANGLRRDAQLARLRANLEPHFLLNTLNAIAGLVSEEPRVARKLIAALGDLLRDTLDDREMETVAEQIDWLRHYAAILELRHRDCLRVCWEIADEAMPLMVPRLMLQPLLENAMLHGALRMSGDGEVLVRVALNRIVGESVLLCEVRDNGPGPGPMRAGAKGLALVQSRLDTLNIGARFHLEPGLPGTRAIVELPAAALVASKEDR